MTNYYNWMFLPIALLLSFGLVACGGGDDDDSAEQHATFMQQQSINNQARVTEQSKKMLEPVPVWPKTQNTLRSYSTASRLVRKLILMPQKLFQQTPISLNLKTHMIEIQQKSPNPIQQ